MGKAKSGFLERVEAAKQIAALNSQKFTRQLALDLSMIVLNREFGFGPDRLRRFGEAMIDMFGEYCDIWNGDSADTEYSRYVLDRSLKQVLGEDGFLTWEERYR